MCSWQIVLGGKVTILKWHYNLITCQTVWMPEKIKPNQFHYFCSYSVERHWWQCRTLSDSYKKKEEEASQALTFPPLLMAKVVTKYWNELGLIFLCGVKKKFF